MTGGAPSFAYLQAEPRRTAGSPPLLLLLHGIGADENDLFPIATMLDPRFHVVSLRAPQTYVMGYSWFSIDFLPSGEVRPHVDEALEALAALTEWLAEAPERFGTDPARTYVLGFSQGAMMSLGVLGTRPELLAGLVALSGRDPQALFPMRAPVAEIARVPLFVGHGLYDDVLPVEHGRRTRAAMEGVIRDLTYHEYPVAHGVSDAEVRDVAAWLTAHLDVPVPVAGS